jgi:hypothetical protein
MFEMFSEPLPVLDTVTICELVTPTTTFPKLIFIGEIEITADCPALVPVPLSPTTTLGVDESLVIVMLPERLPVVGGTRLALNVAVWPAATLNGAVTPLNEKPDPVTEMFEMFNATLPVLVTVIACELVTPVTTLPKLMLVGETEIADCPELEPVPVNAIVETAGFVFAVMEMLPVAAPAAVGANLALNVVLWPDPTDIGNVNPLTEKPVPEAESCVIVSVELPVFVTVKVWVAVDPVATLPKVPVAPAIATVVVDCGGAGVVSEFALVSPVHPI